MQERGVIDESGSLATGIPGGFAEAAIGIALVVVVATVSMGIAAGSLLTDDQMYIVRPLLGCLGIFVMFAWLLRVRTQSNLFGEIGFIYLALGLAYTLFPGITFLVSDFSFPLFSGLNVVSLSPQPQELGAHFWRHLLFVAGVGAGYLLARGGPVSSRTSDEGRSYKDGSIVAAWIVVIILSIVTVTLLSAPVTSYLDYYTRFDRLSGIALRLAYLCLTLKSGGYIVLLGLLFRQYRRYRLLIYVLVPLMCIYEGVYSFGSRIESLTILLAFIGFYNYKVTPIRASKGFMYFVALAILFSGVELFRSSDYSVRDAQSLASSESGQQVAEFGAVYSTSYHLYAERAQGSLPPRTWRMFFYEFLALIPFLDHTTDHPLYWYARNYFPDALVPPATMGVLALSAIWGGEWSLLVMSLINGALFAYLTRWFIQRRDNWLAVNVYVFCYATCVLTLKYSVLYQIVPMYRLLLPALLLTELLFRVKRASGAVKYRAPQAA